MCGIVGYVGRRQATDILLDGLRRLEYRGYDSAGLAVLGNPRLKLRRTVGRVARLVACLAADPADGTVGIAHTRWATHGPPTEKNAHPHVDQSGRIALVHNGVIENHGPLRSYLEDRGVVFQSDTDTEVLAQLIGYFYSDTGDLAGSVRHALREVRGTFGIALVCTDMQGSMIAARRGSPLIVGIGDGEFVVASDGAAIAPHTRQVTFLDDNEMILLGPDGWQVTTIDADEVEKSLDTLEVTLDEIDLNGYKHHMLKEIVEQPESLRNVTRGRLQSSRGEIVLGGLVSCRRELARCRRLLLFGCGTAWHAALIGEYLFEELAEVPTEVEYASELRYRNRLIEEGTVAIAISQSGETADTLAALREVQARGALGLGIVNVVGSTIARDTDAGVYLHVGAEIGVASTKAFTAQVAVLAMMAADLGRRRHLSVERMTGIIEELERIPAKVAGALELDSQLRALAMRLAEWENWLYLGRGINYPVALEGALKLKEVSYIHAEGLPAAEMKHGPIALIGDGTPVVVIAPRDHTFDKVLANIEEVRCRGGRVIVVANAEDRQLEDLAEEVLYVPTTMPLLSPLLTCIPLQLLAYHVAVVRGTDVDKPRNLAKSVTVE